MSWGELAQLLTALGVLGTLVRGMLSDRRIRKDVAGVREHVETVETKVEVVHKATNSLTDRLVALTAKESHAAGDAEGHERGLQEGREERRE